MQPAGKVGKLSSGVHALVVGRVAEAYLRHVIARIGAHPVNPLHDLPFWNIATPATRSVAA
jgi:hypothetical protein